MKLVLLTLAALIIADGVITQFLIRHGLGYEWNPFLQSFVVEYDFLQIKLAGAFLGTLSLWYIYKTRPVTARGISLVFMVLYSGILYWNLGVFFLT